MISKFIFIIFLGLLEKVNSNVIGIDFGSDSMKVAIVQPGSPLEIVSNLQSKRKTPTAISFYKGERLFGSDATAIIARKPELTFMKLNRAIGRNLDSPAITELKEQYFPYELYKNETTGRTLFKQEETYYSPEELLAMMMQYAKDITQNHGGKVIKDCVLTVPSSFTQHERMAIYAAADIANLRVLSLIEENTAAALHYGIDRVFEQPHTVLYYNMGANSVQVSIVTYSSYMVKEGGKNKTIGQFEVIGKAWDSSLGGFSFDVKLAELLADRFNQVWAKKGGAGKDLRDFVRPMTRLRNEAVKVKEVLSANNEYPIKAEQLHADVDLITKVTRTELEEACADLFARITTPIQTALDMANISLSNINAVELLGGGVRVPKVKKLLEDYFKQANIDLGQHMNGDESMALGAAFRAANLSTAFRVRKVGLSDISSFGVSLKLETLPVKPGFFGSLFGGDSKKSSEEEAWSKQTSLYPRLSAVPSKTKTVAFNYDKDILCKIEYDDEVPLPVGTTNLLAVYNISGITEFAKETNSKGLGMPKVHLSFTLDSSGVVLLNKAEATVELPPEPEPELEPEDKTAAAATSAEDDKDNTSTSTTEADAETTTATATATDESASEDSSSPAEDTNAFSSSSTETNSTETPSNSTDSKADKDKKKSKNKPKVEKKIKKDTTLRKVLTVEENPSLITPPSWTAPEVTESSRRLQELDFQDKQRRAKEAALNELEAYIYKVKNRLMDDEKELTKVSTEDQRQTVLDLTNAASEWLDDEGMNSDVVTYKAKQTEIKVPAEAIFKRYSELTDRPAAINKAREQLTMVKTVVAKWQETLPQVTEEEKSKLIDLVEKAVVWLDQKEADQKTKTAYEEPAFDSADVLPQLKMLTLQFEKLLRKPKPPPEKKNSTEPIKLNATNPNGTDTNSTEENATDSTADSNSNSTSGDSSTDDSEL